MSNKTKAKVKNDQAQTALKAGDIGYIDGYVRGGNDAPLAVFVREKDGIIDLVPLYNLRAFKAG